MGQDKGGSITSKLLVAGPEGKACGSLITPEGPVARNSQQEEADTP